MARQKKEVKYFSVSPKNETAHHSLSIFNVLKEEKSLSVKEIGDKTGISGDIVAEYINSCVKKDLLKLSGSGNGELAKFNNGYARVLGVGFTRDECILTVMDLGGKTLASERVSAEALSGFRGRNKELKEVIDGLRGNREVITGDIGLACVAIPAGVMSKNKKAVEILGEGVSHVFNCDTLIAREATAAGYGERDSRGEDLLYLHTDIGEGVVVKDEMVFEAAEEGEQSSYLRPWGQFSIIATTRDLVDKGVGTDIVTMLNGDIDKLDLGVVFKAAEKGDELAEDLVKRAALALGVRAAYLVNMFGAGVVVLGGGTEKKEGGFISFVKESSERFLLKEISDKLEIVPAVLGEEASSAGAASLCRRELFMEV